jgi:hypothetical protein
MQDNSFQNLYINWKWQDKKSIIIIEKNKKNAQY